MATFNEESAAQELRDQIRVYARHAVNYGKVNRDWVNAQLVRLGAQPITDTAKYQISTPIIGNYGTTVHANSRKEALAKFAQYAADVAKKGEIRSDYHGQGVYSVQFATDYEPTFHSGPEDVEPYDGPVPGFAGLRVAIRQMLMEGVTEQGWGHSYASDAADAMELDTLPPVVAKTVKVPVSGTATLTVNAFDGDSEAADESVQRAVTGFMSRAGTVVINPDEVGNWFYERPSSGDAGFELLTNDDDADDEEPY